MRPITTLLTALLLATAALLPTTAQARLTPHYRTVLNVTSKTTSWTSRPFHLGGFLLFRDRIDCTAYPRKELKSFRVWFLDRHGRVAQSFGSDRIQGGIGSGSDSQPVQPGRYRLRIRTSCTFSPWHVTVLTR